MQSKIVFKKVGFGHFENLKFIVLLEKEAGKHKLYML